LYLPNETSFSFDVLILLPKAKLYVPFVIETLPPAQDVTPFACDLYPETSEYCPVAFVWQPLA
jgi:hypothetical protein